MTADATTKPAAAKAAPTITVSLEVTYLGKANMTLSDFAAEGERAKKVAAAAIAAVGVPGAASAGSVAIGKQKFPL